MIFLGSSNNVGPSRDLFHRVMTIHLNPQCETPATIAYESKPSERVRQNRGKYVAAVLILIITWQNANSPRADVSNIATFDGA